MSKLIFFCYNSSERLDVMIMDLIFKSKKPASIKDFLKEHAIPLKLIAIEKNKFLIRVGKELKTKEDTIKKGDTLTVTIQNEEIDDKIVPQSHPLEILYEDDYLLIVNKPANTPMMISKTIQSDTLANWIAAYYESIGFVGRIHYQNKVDKEVSGVVVVWKHRFIKYLMNQESQTPFRHEYQAILQGVLDQSVGCIDLPIKKSEDELATREVSQDGEECQTEFRVVQKYNTHTHVKITNETGKTHQIRVHFAYFFAPIVGDTIYNKNAKKTDPILLYSSKVIFRHPITTQPIEIEISMPQEFRLYLSKPGL